MLSQNSRIAEELRRINPALKDIAIAIRKSGVNEEEMQHFSHLVDMARADIMREYRIETGIQKVNNHLVSSDDSIPTLDGYEKQTTDPTPEFSQFVQTLWQVINHCKYSDDLVYVKTKYYPIFDEGCVVGKDYISMRLDLLRISVDNAAIKVKTNNLVVEPWYKRIGTWFKELGKQENVDGVPANNQ